MKTVNIILILLTFLLVSCSKKSETSNTSKPKTVYTCPMHHEVISDKPGVCPICHMDLVEKKSDESSGEEMHNSNIHVNPSGKTLANISTVKVTRENITKEFSAYSYLEFPEQNRKVISARFSGRIEKLFADKTGNKINAGSPLFEIYSPELIQMQKEFLIAAANNNPDRLQLIESSKKKLRLAGITDKQISEIETSKNIKNVITFYSPLAGTILEKKIEEGMYINEGNSLYELVDLSTLWNLADVFENDLAGMKTGDMIQLKLNSYPNEVFEGKISYIYPSINALSRTVTVRSEIKNTAGKLKQQMHGTTLFKYNLGSGLTVPEDAVILGGKKNVIWLKNSDASYSSKEVTLGIKFNGKYQILSGLSEGDEIVKSGGFLIDSESRLTNDHGNH